MTLVSIGSYIEGNQTAVTSSTTKLIGTETIVGDLNAGGQVNADVSKQRSAGVFIGIDGHRN